MKQKDFKNPYEIEKYLISKYPTKKHYFDYYARAQENGKYKIIAFDVKGHRNIYANGKWQEMFNNLHLIANAVKNELLGCEKQYNKRIMHRHEEADENNKNISKKLIIKANLKNADTYKNGWMNNPFVGQGDYVHFIIYRDSVKENDVFNLFDKYAKKIAPELTFYSNSLYYETDNANECSTKYWQQYAVGALEKTMKINPNMIYGTENENTKEL